jgi:DNA-directed RNA polymerase subunit omega
MIEALKSDEIVQKVGGRFKLTALVQRRLRELLAGSRPMVEIGEDEKLTLTEIAIREILQDKLTIDYDASNIPRPESIIVR